MILSDKFQKANPILGFVLIDTTECPTIISEWHDKPLELFLKPNE